MTLKGCVKACLTNIFIKGIKRDCAIVEYSKKERHPKKKSIKILARKIQQYIT